MLQKNIVPVLDILQVFKEYLNSKCKHEISEDIKNHYELIENASDYPGIILAVKINEFESLTCYVEELDKWEYTAVAQMNGFYSFLNKHKKLKPFVVINKT